MKCTKRFVGDRNPNAESQSSYENNLNDRDRDRENSVPPYNYATINRRPSLTEINNDEYRIAPMLVECSNLSCEPVL